MGRGREIGSGSGLLEGGPSAVLEVWWAMVWLKVAASRTCWLGLEQSAVQCKEREVVLVEAHSVIQDF